jgi:hypothetical protein
MNFNDKEDLTGYFDGAAAKNWLKVFDLVVGMDEYRRLGVIEQLAKLRQSQSPKKKKKKKQQA